MSSTGPKPAGPPPDAARPRSSRVRVRRGPKLARYDRATLDAILDANPFCHVGYVVDGCPVVTPTLCWREGDDVYWHGSSASRMGKRVRGELEVCLTVTSVDGWVLARSAFHHTVNYRAVMLFGTAVLVDASEKAAHLRTFMEQMFPGRWDRLRPPHPQELKATTVLRLRIDEASAKVRAGPPVDEPEDYGWPVWAGEIPLRAGREAARPDARTAADRMRLGAPRRTAGGLR
jgi:nitroimidazol reductase NimA-like FMN-containing flavoprotein (pyridoxamine 5'-phosphate oxidase superfamily)